MGRLQTGELLGYGHRLPIALEALLAADSLGGQSLGLAGLLEKRPPLGERPFDLGPPLTCAGEGVAVPLELSQRQLALLDGQPRLLDRVLGVFEAARILGTLRVELIDRPFELVAGARRATIGAADRCLETVAQCRLVAIEVGELVVADRRRRAEERLARDAGHLGQRLVGEGRVGDRRSVDLEADRALRPAELLLERAGPDAALVVVDLELEADHGPGIIGRIPRAQ